MISSSLPSRSTSAHRQIDDHVEFLAGQEVGQPRQIALIVRGDVVESPLHGLHLGLDYKKIPRLFIYGELYH